MVEARGRWCSEADLRRLAVDLEWDLDVVERARAALEGRGRWCSETDLVILDSDLDLALGRGR